MVGLTNLQLEKTVKDVESQQESLANELKKTAQDLRAEMEKNIEKLTTEFTSILDARQETLKAELKAVSTASTSQFGMLVDQISKMAAALAAANPSLAKPLAPEEQHPSQISPRPPPTKAAPIHPSFFAEDIYNASPKNPQLTFKNTSRANIEAKVKRYFPEFLTLQEAESPSGPLKEASKRNKVIFPPELQLKYADEDTLRKLNRMQVLMIQSILPYSAWPRRVAMEMEDDFLDTRGDVTEQSLDWVGTVHGILQVLSDHNMLGSPLTTFAQVLSTPDESTLDFARRMRRAFYALPQDLVNGPQARDILIHHIQHSLPRTWSSIQYYAQTMTNKKLANHAAQTTQGISRWKLEDDAFLPSKEVPIRSVKNLSSSPGITNSQIADPRLQGSNIFISKSASPDDPSFVVDKTNSRCHKCGNLGHWSNSCQLKIDHSGGKKKQTEGKGIFRTRFNDEIKQRYTSLKNRRFKNFGNKSSRHKSFVVEKPNESSETDKCPADRLEDSDVDNELEDLLSQVLAQAEEDAE
ncbi:hypothetical protein K3495_g1236 [Podosphaera aphanis]|nr:hypothetical protein K3495_g1236 [Podosphaera aphanis]